MSRRAFLSTSLTAAAVSSAAWAPQLPASAATGSRFIPYTSDSYFKSRVTGIPVNLDRTKQFHSFMATHPDQKSVAYPKIKGVGGNQWGTPWAEGSTTDPVWRIRNIRAATNSQNAILRTRGFHAPAWLDDVITGTSDSPLCVMDTASGFTVFCTDVRVVGTNLIDVGSAAVTHHSSNGLDRRNPRSNDARNFTSRGRVSDAMVIRKTLVDYGINNNTDLGHVLHLFIVESSTADGFCHPMVGKESSKFGFGAEGERLAIRSTVDLTARGLSPAGLVIARTLQTRGCYIGDNAGSMSSLKAEQESSAHPVWGRLLTQDSLKGITWNDFVVLKRP
jgi:hypothetical protein